MTEVNIPLLRKAVEWAEAEHAKGVALSRWEQGNWVTGLAEQQQARDYLSDGFDWACPTSNSYYARAAQKDPECGTAYCIAGYLVHEVEGLSTTPYEGYFNYGAQMLGISNDEAIALFSPDNGIEEVRMTAEDIAGERL